MIVIVGEFILKLYFLFEDLDMFCMELLLIGKEIGYVGKIGYIVDDGVDKVIVIMEDL